MTNEQPPKSARKPANGTPAASPARVRGISERAIAWLFLTPVLVFLLASHIVPLIAAVWFSFTNYRANRPGAPVKAMGLDNYISILGNAEVWADFRASALFMLLAVAVQLSLGLMLAQFIHRNFRGAGAWPLVICLPMLLSPAAVGSFARLLVPPQGPLHPTIALLLADSWMGVPQVMLICLAGLKTIPAHLWESAELDRAGAWQKLRHVSLPLLAPFLITAGLLRALESFRNHDLASFLSAGPAYATLALKVEAFDRWRTGYGSAFAIILSVAIIGLASLYAKALHGVRRP